MIALTQCSPNHAVDFVSRNMFDTIWGISFVLNSNGFGQIISHWSITELTSEQHLADPSFITQQQSKWWHHSAKPCLNKFEFMQSFSRFLVDHAISYMVSKMVTLKLTFDLRVKVKSKVQT